MAIVAFTTSFTPACAGTNVAVTGVTTAATAFDWFSLSGSGTLSTAYAAMPVTTAMGLQNRAFVAMTSQIARADLLPLVKAELFASALSDPKSAISSLITSAGNSLTSIQLSGVDATTKTALAAAYNSEISVINAVLNRVKTLENKIYLQGDSIDVPAATGTGNIATAYAATATLASLTGAKFYLSSLLDPAILGNSGVTIPALTATTFANASTLATAYTSAGTALTGSSLVANLQAFVEMSAKNVFDNYAIDIQGYTSTGTSGKYPSGATAPVGIVPGIDFEIHLTGAYQTGVAAAGNPGAPSSTTAFWS